MNAPGISMILIALYTCSPVASDFASQLATLCIALPFSRQSSILSILAPNNPSVSLIPYIRELEGQSGKAKG